jgi:hypothetical protein
MKWTTKNGEQIDIKKLDDSHLLNILKFIKRRAREGVNVIINCGYATDNDFIEYDGYTMYGNEVMEHMNYSALLKEAKNRGLV